MIATTLGRAREALDTAHGRLTGWQMAPDPRAAALRDLRHVRRTAAMRAVGRYQVVMTWLAEHAGREAWAAWEGWVRLGRIREQEMGLTPEHPDSWFLSSVRGPHLDHEPCNDECEAARAECECDDDDGES